MALLVYKFSDYNYTAEREQYRSLCKQLKSYFANRDEICLFVANYNIYDCELDGILIKQDAIISVEFKNYGGSVSAVENGDWKLSDGTIIKGGSRKTVYQQAKLNHVAIKRGFEDGMILPSSSLRNVAALVVFHQPISLINRLSARTQSWLHVCDEHSFMEKVQDITSPSIDFSKDDMLSLVSKMALSEDYLDKDYSNIELLEKQEILDDAPAIETSCDAKSSSEKNEVDAPLTPQQPEQILDEERQALHDFSSSIIRTICKGLSPKIRVFNSLDAAPLFIPYGISLSKKHLVVVEAEGIGLFCQKIERFIQHTVRAVKPDLVIWEEGVDLENQPEKPDDENFNANGKESTIEDKPALTDSSKATILYRKSKTVLPHWLDKYLFNSLAAQYAPEHERYEYNLDLNEEEVKVYLGTYFPRSYAEAFCIYDNLLQNPNYHQIMSSREEINILDMGCGTGGEILGVITALSKHIEQSVTININACDGNEYSLSALRELCSVAQKYSHHSIKVSVHKKTFVLKTKIDVKGIDDIPYDIILCDKFVCELISHNVIPDKAYYKVAKSLVPLLSDEGVFIILDVTTKDERTGFFYPQLMNMDLNRYTADFSAYETILPLPCGQNSKCLEPCFMQQTFTVSHSHRSNDESRVCYRVLSKSCLKQKMSLPHYENAAFVIHPTKYSQGDNSSICIHSDGGIVIDSFNINS